MLPRDSRSIQTRWPFRFLMDQIDFAPRPSRIIYRGSFMLLVKHIRTYWGGYSDRLLFRPCDSEATYLSLIRAKPTTAIQGSMRAPSTYDKGWSYRKVAEGILILDQFLSSSDKKSEFLNYDPDRDQIKLPILWLIVDFTVWKSKLANGFLVAQRYKKLAIITTKKIDTLIVTIITVLIVDRHF